MEWNYNVKYLPIPFVFLVATIFLCYHEDLTTTRILFPSGKYHSNSSVNFIYPIKFSFNSSFHAIQSFFVYACIQFVCVYLKQSWLRRDDLEIALAKASTAADKTVIIAVINEAYVEPCDGEYPSMFDLFLEGFWVGEETRPLLRRLLVVSMDTTAHERCRFRRLNCFLLAAGGRGGGFAGEKLYMSGEFIEMMWRRTAFLLDVLKRGYDFIFTVRFYCILISYLFI